MDKHFYVIELDNMGGFNIFGNSGDGRDEHEFIATPTDTEADELRRYISQYIPEEYKNLS
ncbi:MAG: hypothetical protein FWE13_01795 [Firmicutes bacterium]|nr:hypothetical protein [Bacillota bacterium]